MAVGNAVYPLYKQEMIKTTPGQAIGLDGTTTTGTWCQLLNIATYTYSAAHQFFSSLSGIVGTDQEVTTKTFVNGLFKATDVLTWTAVAGGSTISGLVLYRKNAGANTTWPLVLYEDTGVTGFPVTTNGGNVTVTWSGSGIVQF